MMQPFIDEFKAVCLSDDLEYFKNEVCNYFPEAKASCDVQKSHFKDSHMANQAFIIGAVSEQLTFFIPSNQDLVDRNYKCLIVYYKYKETTSSNEEVKVMCKLHDNDKITYFITEIKD